MSLFATVCAVLWLAEANADEIITGDDIQSSKARADIVEKIQNISIGTHAEEVMKLLGPPDLWGTVTRHENSLIGDYSIAVPETGSFSSHLSEIHWIYFDDGLQSESNFFFYFKDERLMKIFNGSIGWVVK